MLPRSDRPEVGAPLGPVVDPAAAMQALGVQVAVRVHVVEDDDLHYTILY